MTPLDGLECCHCGIAILAPDPDGLYTEGDCAICPECGCESVVGLRDEHEDPPIACADTSDDPIDWGQGQCDGTCGAVAGWISEGHRCRLDCARIPAAVRQRVRGMIEADRSEDEIRDAMGVQP